MFLDNSFEAKFSRFSFTPTQQHSLFGNCTRPRQIFSFNNHDERDLLIITISWGRVGDLRGICEEVPGLDVSYCVGSVIVYIFCKTLFDGGLSSGFVSVIVTLFLSVDFVAPW